MTFREIDLAISGHYQKKEYEKRDVWESARLVAYFTVLPNIKKGKKFTPKDVMTFSWEKESLSPPDYEARKKRGIERAKKWRKSVNG